jgi:septal ring factor EnvC (AmiA/AmiB activator)
MPSTPETESELVEALSKLETALLSPVVAGELDKWAETGQEAMALVAASLPPYFQNVLHPQYKQIARTDPELLTRIEQLIAEDQRLVEEFAKFSRRLASFAEAAALVKKHESKVNDELASLEQDGIALIVRVRKQRATADTWLTEAVYRDRGDVD